MQQITRRVDLNNKIPEIQDEKLGTIRFLEAIIWKKSPTVLVFYSVNGVQPEILVEGVKKKIGVRLELKNPVFLDDFVDDENLIDANGSFREHWAPKIWQSIVDELRP